MTDKSISVKLPPDLWRKLHKESEKNRHFNNKSELVRLMVEMYFNDPSFKRRVNQGAKLKFREFIDSLDT